MKKIITLLTVATLCLSLCSCGGSTPASEESSDPAVEDVSSDSTSQKPVKSSSGT